MNLKCSGTFSSLPFSSSTLLTLSSLPLSKNAFHPTTLFGDRWKHFLYLYAEVRSL